MTDVVGTWLFGSVARGEDTTSSDVDIAVVIDAAETRVPVIADAIREALAHPARVLAFTPSVVALSLNDIQRLRDERAPLWTDWLRDAQVLAGLGPRKAAEP